MKAASDIRRASSAPRRAHPASPEILRSSPQMLHRSLAAQRNQSVMLARSGLRRVRERLTLSAELAQSRLGRPDLRLTPAPRRHEGEVS